MVALGTRACLTDRALRRRPAPPCAEDKSRYPEAVAFGRRQGSEAMLRSLKASHLSMALYCLNDCESAIVFS